MKRCLHCMKLYDDNLIVCPYCLYEEESQPKVSYFLSPGTVIGNRYLIGEVIGSGGFGITYVGWDRVLNLKVAIKEYFPSGVASRENGDTRINITGATTEEFYREGISKFLEEARLIAAFREQPNIVHIFNFLEENNTAYIIMEYIDGVTLEEYLNKRGEDTLPWNEVVKTTEDLLGVLKEVHLHGIIHRDISPANIMITSEGAVKLLDFGAARQFVAGRTQEMSVIVKKGYAPVEQYKSAYRQDERSDLYSIGAVMYKMLTGQQPVDALNRVSVDILIKPRNINKDIPIWLENVVLRAMNMNLYGRYASADDFIDALNTGDTKRKKRKTIIAAALASAIILACMSGGIAVNHTVSKKEAAKANCFVDMPGTIDLHKNEDCQTFVYLECIDEGLEDYLPDNYKMTYKISDKSVADVSKNDIGEMLIHAKKAGRTTLSIKTPYAAKEININVKKDEAMYPEYEVSQTTLLAGKDIPPGEYVAFARNCRGEVGIWDKGEQQEVAETTSFNYNYYFELTEGEIIEIKDAYLVPSSEAMVDVGADGMFKVGKDLEKGKYRTVLQEGDTAFTIYDLKTGWTDDEWDCTSEKEIELNEANEYIFLSGGYLEKSIEQGIYYSKLDSQNWKLRNIEIDGEKLTDYDGYIDADMTDELKAVLSCMEKYYVYINIDRDGSARFAIPSGVEIKKGEKTEAASLGSGIVTENEDGSYTYTIKKPDFPGKKNTQNVNKKGTKFRFEQVSESELHFYYTYFDMVLVFER